MRASFQLQESPRQIKNMMIEALLPEIDRYLHQVLSKIKLPIQNTIARAIKDSPEYQSLVDNAGKLRGALGVVDAKAKLELIIDKWKSDVGIGYDPPTNVGGKIRAGFSLQIIRGDYADVINLAVSKFISENNYLVPWLEWLLLAGRSRVVQNYVIEYGPSRRSRTGLAVMRKHPSGSFSVPSEFAGTDTDNFVTRALDKASNEILEIIVAEMERT